MKVPDLHLMDPPDDPNPLGALDEYLIDLGCCAACIELSFRRDVLPEWVMAAGLDTLLRCAVEMDLPANCNPRRL